MSSASFCRHQRLPEGIQQLLAWYKIRDTLMGYNHVVQDMKKALELAAACKHPDAVWLTKLFAGCSVKSKEEARRVFLGCEDEPKALSFAALLDVWVREEAILQAADLGDAFAQVRMAWRTYGEKRFEWAKKSATQGERDGFYLLGRCYDEAEGCKRNVGRAKKNFLIAAELGYVRAMINFGLCLGTDPQRFAWLGKAAISGYSHSFLNEMVQHMGKFNCETGHANVVFAIGRALKGQIDNDAHQIFGFLTTILTLLSDRRIKLLNFTIFSWNRIEERSILGLLLAFVAKLSKTFAF
jgi:hypothetical protein